MTSGASAIPIVRPVTHRLSDGTWQRTAFVSTGVGVILLGGLTWRASKEPLAVLSAAVFAIIGLWMCAAALLTRLALSSDGFVLSRFWRRRWSWADVQGFYVVHGARGTTFVGYVPTREYRARHRLARFLVTLHLANYVLPVLGMDASQQVELMNRWLQRHGGG